MTFYEAAVEVLRQSGRPLHYKKITEIAVREELLSHVGKTPHLTMNDRLEKEIQKNEASAIEQERPGVFKLDEEHADEITERIKRKRKEEKQRKKQRRAQSQRDSQQHEQQQKKEHQNQQGNNRQQQSNQHQGSDDDGPKRRRSRGSKKDEEPQTRKKRRDGDSSQDQQRDSGGDSGGGDDRPRRRRRSRSDRDDSGGGESLPAETSTEKHLDEGPVRLKGIPRAAHQVLDEAGHPLPIDDLADRIFDQKLVKFHTHSPVTTVKSALANDNQIRQRRGHRNLFESDDSDRWRLTEWDLEARVHRKEQAALSLSEAIRQDTKRQLGRALKDVKPEAFEHLALTLLERLGYHNIKVSKRSSEGDVFFTADWRQGLSDVRVCVRVVTDHERTVQEQAVVDLRDTLDHYSASEGVIIHLGSVTDAAVDKGRVDGAPPITLLDGDTFVELLMKHGIGVRVHDNPIVTVDSEFVDALAD